MSMGSSFITREADVENPTTALEFEKDAIRAFHVVRNPAELPSSVDAICFNSPTEPAY